MVPQTKYVSVDGLFVAYQVFGDGPANFVFVPGFISHIEHYWEQPAFARWFERIGTFARVALFDKRGTGLSDRLGRTPNMDDRMDDVRAVMDAVGMERAAVMGLSEGGSLAALFAASHQDRCSHLILHGSFAKFSSWFPTAEDLEMLFAYMENHWGTGASLPNFAPTMQSDPIFQRWWGGYERLGASPGAAKDIMKLNSQIDISHILSTIKAPTLVTHRTGDVTIDIEAGRYLANNIPNARLVELPGDDHFPFVGEGVDIFLDEIERFVSGSVASPTVDRALATILFTDIVDSTARAVDMGDQRWRDLLDTHDVIIQRSLNRHFGHPIKSTGDGFLATFDRPGRAVKCAIDVSNELKELNIPIRAGVHTGEVEFTADDDVRGIAVHIASRVCSKAKSCEVWVSQTVRDLIAGSGITLSDQGQHELKGAPEQWQLFEVAH